MFQGIHSRGTIMSRFIISTVAILGLLALSADAAFAQHRHRGGSHHGGSHYGGGYGGGGYYSNTCAPRYAYSGYQSYQPSYQSYQPSYGYSGGYYHDTSHYDYHGPSLQRHGNHYDYVPGHYDYHRTGHWHR
jgi:hypothetical protein